MRSLLMIAAVAALGASARADGVDDEAPPLPRRSVGVQLLMQATSFGGLHTGGAGVSSELAFARHRLQYFGEASVAIVGVGAGEINSGAGLSTRAGLGLRWIPRSFPVDRGAFDLLLEAFVGVEHLRWSGERLTRPQAGVGVSWQVRMPSKLAVRLGTRVFVAPASEDAMMAVCRGSCSSAAANSADYGFLGLFGVAW